MTVSANAKSKAVSLMVTQGGQVGGVQQAGAGTAGADPCTRT